MILASRKYDGTIVSWNGVPVWPLSDAFERRIIVAACRNFNRTIRWIGDAQQVAVSGRGVAVAYGTEAAAVASLYAHLTGRRLHVARDREELLHVRSCQVIVTLLDRIDDDFLEEVYRANRRSCVGLITGRTTVELRRRALVCAVAATSDLNHLPHRVELHPNFDFATVSGTSCTIIGRRSSAGEVRKAISRGGTAIMIHGHGDGIDGDLGSLVLCPVDRDWRSDTGEHPPVCRTTGLCHRRKIAISSREHAAVRVHPTEISARALLWNTCIGFASPHGFIHPRWSVGSRLAASTTTAAYITTWRIAIVPPVLTTALMDRIISGETLGAAIGRHNASRSAQRWGNRLCLFGDPDTRIAPLVLRRRSRPRSHVRTRSPQNLPASRVSSTAGAGVHFMAACLASPHAQKAISSESQVELSFRDRARDALAIVQVGLRSHRSLAQQGHKVRELCSAFLTYAAHRGIIRDLWLPTAARIEAVGSQSCCNCGGNVIRYRASLSDAQTPPRALLVCNRCEVVADRPECRVLSAKITHRGIQLIGDDLDCPAWAGAVCAGSRWPISARYWTWPSEVSGAAQRFMPFTDMAWTHPSEVSVFMMLGLDVCVLSRTLRSLQTQPEAE